MHLLYVFLLKGLLSAIFGLITPSTCIKENTTLIKRLPSLKVSRVKREYTYIYMDLSIDEVIVLFFFLIDGTSHYSKYFTC